MSSSELLRGLQHHRSIQVDHTAMVPSPSIQVPLCTPGHVLSSVVLVGPSAFRVPAQACLRSRKIQPVAKAALVRSVVPVRRCAECLEPLNSCLACAAVAPRNRPVDSLSHHAPFADLGREGVFSPTSACTMPLHEHRRSVPGPRSLLQPQDQAGPRTLVCRKTFLPRALLSLSFFLFLFPTRHLDYSALRPPFSPLRPITHPTVSICPNLCFHLDNRRHETLDHPLPRLHRHRRLPDP